VIIQWIFGEFVVGRWLVLEPIQIQDKQAARLIGEYNDCLVISQMDRVHRVADTLIGLEGKIPTGYLGIHVSDPVALVQKLENLRRSYFRRQIAEHQRTCVAR